MSVQETEEMLSFRVPGCVTGRRAGRVKAPVMATGLGPPDMELPLARARAAFVFPSVSNVHLVIAERTIGCGRIRLSAADEPDQVVGQELGDGVRSLNRTHGRQLDIRPDLPRDRRSSVFDLETARVHPSMGTVSTGLEFDDGDGRCLPGLDLRLSQLERLLGYITRPGDLIAQFLDRCLLASQLAPRGAYGSEEERNDRQPRNRDRQERQERFGRCRSVHARSLTRGVEA